MSDDARQLARDSADAILAADDFLEAVWTHHFGIWDELYHGGYADGKRLTREAILARFYRLTPAEQSSFATRFLWRWHRGNEPPKAQLWRNLL